MKKLQALEIFNKIEATSKTKEKIALLKQALSEEDFHTSYTASSLVHYALDYQKLYYMKDIPEIVGKGPYNPDWLDQFTKLLAACMETGRTQETKANVVNWLETQHPEVAKWCRRVLLKDLRCGVSVETANKANYNVPVFEVQLATDGKKCKKVDKLFPALVGPKLDGYRCLAIVDKSDATLLSRNGTEFQNFPQIKEALVELANKLNAHTLIFDGEIMSNDFNKMQQSAFASKRGTTVGDVVYNIFDTISFAEWQHQTFTLPYFDRYNKLVSTAENFPENIRLVEHKKVTSLDEVLALEKKYLEEGYEGAMFKPNIPYYFGKKQNRMLKFKTMLSQDCEITGTFEGGGKYIGMLGGLIVAQENGETCEVGSGFTDAMRTELWEARDTLKGRMVEIKYQELTPDGVMRFPIFIRFRPDKERK